MNNEELGKDLRSVQALQRKHEGLERDLAALGDKINLLDEKENKISISHLIIFELKQNSKNAHLFV